MKLQRVLQILFTTFLVLSSGCAHPGPQVTVGISDPERGGMDCYDEKTAKKFFEQYIDTDKWVCMPPTDAQEVFNFCSDAISRCKEKK